MTVTKTYCDKCGKDITQKPRYIATIKETGYDPCLIASAGLCSACKDMVVPLIKTKSITAQKLENAIK